MERSAKDVFVGDVDEHEQAAHSREPHDRVDGDVVAESELEKHWFAVGKGVSGAVGDDGVKDTMSVGSVVAGCSDSAGERDDVERVGVVEGFESVDTFGVCEADVVVEVTVPAGKGGASISETSKADEGLRAGVGWAGEIEEHGGEHVVKGDRHIAGAGTAISDQGDSADSNEKLCCFRRPVVGRAGLISLAGRGWFLTFVGEVSEVFTVKFVGRSVGVANRTVVPVLVRGFAAEEAVAEPDGPAAGVAGDGVGGVDWFRCFGHFASHD